MKGKAIDSRLGSGENTHYSIEIVDKNKKYRIAVNVQSEDSSNLEYVFFSHWSHPIIDDIRGLPFGLHHIPSKPAGIALDYIRGNLVDPREFISIPMNIPGKDNDLNEKIDQYVQRGMADENSEIYAFGSAWGPDQPERDKIFGFYPGNGIHNIHMNQGNSSEWYDDDGVWQDGGLIFHFPSNDQWVAIFLKFENQVWHTDDVTGHALEIPTSGPPSDSESLELLRPNTMPTADRPDGLVRIVAALINDSDSPERETVTILNTSNQEINLNGWKIADKQKYKMTVDGTIGRGAIKTFEIVPPVTLSNKGGIITLLDDRGIKVDGVSYTKAQTSRPGWTTPF